MENNNEIIENSEEVMETATEEIVKAASSNSSFSTATKLGLAMIAGGLICKYVYRKSKKKRLLRVYGLCQHLRQICHYNEAR